MERPLFKNIKTEPCSLPCEQLLVADIEIKQESEIEIGEIDETTFLQGYPESSKTATNSNNLKSIEDVTIYDQIIKEEPVFYDEVNSQVLSCPETEEETSKSAEYSVPTIKLELNDKKKQIEDKIFECFICRCETINIGLLKWHLQERHLLGPLVGNQQSAQRSLQQSKKQELPRTSVEPNRLKNRYSKAFQAQKSNQQKDLDGQQHNVQNQSNKRGLECSYHSTKSQLKPPQVKKLNRTNVKQNGSKEKHSNSSQTKKSHKQHDSDAQQMNSLQGQITDSVLKCSYCHRKFNTIQRVKNHERIHTSDQPYKCSSCSKGYNTKAHFDIHMRRHTGEKPFSCETCGIKFHSSFQLYRHKKAHAKKIVLAEPHSQRTKIVENVEPNDFANFRIFECYLCRFRGGISTLQVHMRENHTGKKLYRCKICSKKFAHKASIYKHMNTHSKSNQCECKVCGKTLASENGLVLHLQTHKGEYKHECKYCHKKYTTNKILRSHIRTHIGIKPYECEYCKRGFLRQADMVRHTLIHTGERPYKCDICDVTFSRNHLLTDHKKNVHSLRKFKLNTF
ncbi:zinc finger protein 436-like [Sitodiplosis mosellana]|uniref:zinc finger protein 436-like n=1 Tax=Sitodiplosis mosellana TaxID=263140 RepID=UPI002444148E|nr:zinc finger protein 436-like [Sitodiplosis mosellana]